MQSASSETGEPPHVSVIRALRRDVLTGRLQAGASVDEDLVGSLYGADLAVARIAIEDLVGRRLLRRVRGRGVTVARIPAEAVDDIYRARELIERECILRLAANCHIPYGAREANQKIQGLVSDDPLSVVGPDMSFHLSLVEAARSHRVTTMYRSLADEVRLCMVQVQGAALLPTQLIADEHDAILRHISAGDADQAATMIRRHLSRARERLVSHLISAR